MYDWEENAWIWSKDGKKLSLIHLKPSDVEIDEIAHSLSNTCRFGGHCREYYSVAEHCVIMANIMEEQGFSKDEQLGALLHDASEYILTDVPRPFKPMMPEYNRYETYIMEVVEKKFGVDCHTPEIKELDNRMVGSEARALFKNPTWVLEWPYPEIPDFQQVHLACLDPKAAYFAFMLKYKELTNE